MDLAQKVVTWTSAWLYLIMTRYSYNISAAVCTIWLWNWSVICMLNGGITLPMKESRAEIIERIAQDIKKKRSMLRIYVHEVGHCWTCCTCFRREIWASVSHHKCPGSHRQVCYGKLVRTVVVLNYSLHSARMHSEGTVVGSVCLSVCVSISHFSNVC